MSVQFQFNCKRHGENILFLKQAEFSPMSMCSRRTQLPFESAFVLKKKLKIK